MSRRNRNRRFVAEINVVPYIDVMLVLLIIFMVTAPLLTQGVQVDLPQASAKVIPSESNEPVVLSVDQSGRYYLNIARNPDKPIADREAVLLVAAQLKIDPKRAILVKGDKHVDYGQVVSAMVLLQQAGADKIGLVTDGGEEVSKG